jgi:predicted GTPase
LFLVKVIAWMLAMRRQILFVTGTDTGVGKTVLAALLAQHLRRTGRHGCFVPPLAIHSLWKKSIPGTFVRRWRHCWRPGAKEPG